ncbi:MAG TPA: hypothetical protein VMD59_10360 [Acidimicrobiales bacterium]|nr:hypothetical protein [Acidimicrobiales bacterium]
MPVRGNASGRGECREATICCAVERVPGSSTAVSSPEGRLALFDLVVSLSVPGTGGAGGTGAGALAIPGTRAVPIGRGR